MTTQRPPNSPLSHALILLEDAKARLESIRDDIQSEFDDLPESVQELDRGESLTQVISYLDDAIGNTEEAISNASASGA